MLAENAWSADSEWGGVKALCGAAQEWRHLLDGTIYPPVQLPHLNTTSPSRERASRAPLPYAPQSLHLIPILLVPMGAPSCMVAAVLACVTLSRRTLPEKPCYACIIRSWRPPWTSWSACGLSSTVLATVLDAHMMANARAATALAFDSFTIVFANARAATALAFASFAVVFANARAATALA